MAGCQDDIPAADSLTQSYRRVLWAALVINGVMALGEGIGGWLAGSQALQADALDFLGDTATYALTLAVLTRSARTRAMAALVKGISLILPAIAVLATTAWRSLAGSAPEGTLMSGIGLIALAANAATALLLMRHRHGDANMRSVWLCSRNDAVGNAAVILAGLAVIATGSRWPDLIVAAGIGGLFLHSASSIIRQSLGELRAAKQAEAPTPPHINKRMK